METLATVLTGDIIRSSDLDPAQREGLPGTMEDVFAAVRRHVPSFRAEQFRGDAFQAVIEGQPDASLRALLLIMTFLQVRGYGIRISMGLGTVSFDNGSIITSDGSAF